MVKQALRGEKRSEPGLNTGCRMMSRIIQVGFNTAFLACLVAEALKAREMIQ